MEQVRHFDEPKVCVSWHSPTFHRPFGDKADVPYCYFDSFKMQSQGVYVPRASFPQLPGSVCVNPTFIQTKHG
jgi:hypothetical protein